MGRISNVNVDVYLEELNKKRNVNVMDRAAKKSREFSLVNYIMDKLGPESKKDEAFWHKVAKKLSEEQIATGIEIAENKKPYGIARIRYVGGIYANMMRGR